MNGWKKQWAVGCLLLLLFALLVGGSRRVSLTADEPSHIASGYAFLARGLDGLWTLAFRGHPLLIDAWIALPFYLAYPDIPLESLEGWQTDYGAYLHGFGPYLEPRSQTQLLTRVPEMLLALLLAAVVYRWAVDAWGAKAGLLALGILTFDPTLLAHGRLATNDVGTVALGTCSLYLAWRWWQRRRWQQALSLALLLTATLLGKQSGILWVGAIGLGTLWVGITERRSKEQQSEDPRSEDRRSRAFWMQCLLIVVLTLVLFWAAYGFSVGPVPRLSLSLPAPAHWQGIFRHETRSENRLVFALGMRKQGRWWWYFPLAFFLKNPLPFLLWTALGLGVLARRPKPRYTFAAGLFGISYLAAALVVGMNIGYRHMLPLHPYLYLIAGAGLARWMAQRPHILIQRILLTITAIWYIVGTTRLLGSEIAYFNELVGGPAGGYRYLVDSNLAWGQTVEARDAYLQTHPATQVEPPAAKFRPAPGTYVVNASYLQGLGIDDPDVYGWFRHQEPIGHIGYSNLLYEVSPFEPAWIAQCQVPRAPLEPETIAQGLGRGDLRTIKFDCTQAWLYPGGTEQAGIYALHYDQMAARKICLPALLPCPSTPGDPFLKRHLSTSRLSFEQVKGGKIPPFALYESAPQAMQHPDNAEIYAERAGTSPAAHSSADALPSPIALQGPLLLLGGAAYVEKDALTVETWWQVIEGPIPRPFSIIGQLLMEDGQMIAGGDGLGVSPLELLPGDVLVQRHRFAQQPAGVAIWVRTGAYWLDDMQRWPLEPPAGTDTLLLHIPVESTPQ